MNHDFIAEHRAAFDLLDVRAGTAILIVRDHEHLVSLRPFTQCAHRNGDGLTRGADRYTDPHRGARRWCLTCTVDFCAHHSISCRRGEPWVESPDRGRNGI